MFHRCLFQLKLLIFSKVKFQRPRGIYQSVFLKIPRTTLIFIEMGKMTGLWNIWNNWIKVLASSGMFYDVSVPKCTKTVFKLRIGPLRVNLVLFLVTYQWYWNLLKFCVTCNGDSLWKNIYYTPYNLCILIPSHLRDLSHQHTMHTACN